MCKGGQSKPLPWSIIIPTTADLTARMALAQTAGHVGWPRQRSDEDQSWKVGSQPTNKIQFHNHLKLDWAVSSRNCWIKNSRNIQSPNLFSNLKGRGGGYRYLRNQKKTSTWQSIESGIWDSEREREREMCYTWNIFFESTVFWMSHSDGTNSSVFYTASRRYIIQTFLNGVTPQGLSNCSGWPDITKRPAGSDWTRTWFHQRTRMFK